MSAQITRPGSHRPATWAILAALGLTTAGCRGGDGPPATPAFVPSWEEARDSLDAALSAWRDAPSPAPASIDVRGVQFVDKTRKPDQRLLSFQVLAQTDIENARQFTVRLNLEGEEAPLLVKYNILGRDPVWVFRLDDYEMFAHWEHDMDPPGAKPRPAEK